MRKHAELLWSAASLFGLVTGALLSGVPANVAVSGEVLLPLIPVAAGGFFAAVLVRGWFGKDAGPGEAASGTGVFKEGARPDTIILSAAIIYAATVLAAGNF